MMVSNEYDFHRDRRQPGRPLAFNKTAAAGEEMKLMSALADSGALVVVTIRRPARLRS